MSEKVRHLRQEPHGHIYVWTPELALRPDMKECELPEKKPEFIEPEKAVEPVKVDEAPKVDEVVPPVPSAEAGTATIPPTAGEAFDFDAMDELALKDFAASRSINVPGTIKKVETLREFIKKACV